MFCQACRSGSDLMPIIGQMCEAEGQKQKHVGRRLAAIDRRPVDRRNPRGTSNRWHRATGRPVTGGQPARQLSSLGGAGAWSGDLRAAPRTPI